jgi:ParB-like chromosome segregation protein Spo0J
MKLAVHPAADIFPMMSDDELQELAADIAENGLQVAIILDHTQKVLIDGRNRLEACKPPMWSRALRRCQPMPIQCLSSWA